MGFVKGKTVTVVKKAPLRDPIEYKIMGYDVSLRKSEASLIDVITLEDARNLHHEYGNYAGTIDDKSLKTSVRKKKFCNRYCPCWESKFWKNNYF